MEPRKRIPQHAHSGPNDGGLIAGSTVIALSGGGSDGGGATVAALDDLTDVTISAPATGDRLRYTGSGWANSALVWTPVTTYDGTNWMLAVDGSGNAIMTEA